MDTTPATYTDFMREMRTLCTPHGVNLPKFEKACEAMWYEGDMSSSSIARLVSVSRPTAIKWLHAAKSLGLTKHQRRPRSAAHEKEVAKTREKIVSMTPDEMRAHYVASLHTAFEKADGNPQVQTNLVSTIATLVPGLKAPETRLDVQILLGRDNADRIEDGLAENLKWIMGHDRNFARRLLAKAGLTTTDLLAEIPEATDAEAEVVDDAPSSDPQPAGKSRAS